MLTGYDGQVSDDLADYFCCHLFRNDLHVMLSNYSHLLITTYFPSIETFVLVRLWVNVSHLKLPLTFPLCVLDFDSPARFGDDGSESPGEHSHACGARANQPSSGQNSLWAAVH